MINLLPLAISILCLIGFFLIMRTTFSKSISAISSVALVYNVPFVWYSKTVSSEMLVLLFVLCIAILASDKSRLKSKENSVIIGVMMGVLGLVRFDSVLVWLGLFPAMLFTIDREEASRTRIAISSYFITLE